MKKASLLLTLILSTFIYSQEDINHVLVTTDTYTFLESNLVACKPHIFTNTNVTATIPVTSFDSFAFLPIKLLNNNSTLTIIPDSGVNQLQFVYDNSNLDNGGDAISLYSYNNNEWGIWKGTSNVTVSPYALSLTRNYYEVANALADDTNEINDAITGISTSRSEVTVETTEISSGNYALRVEKIMSGGARIDLAMTLDNNTDYKMTFLVKGDGSSGFTPNAWSGVTNFVIESGTTSTLYSSYSITFTTTSNSQIARFYNYGALNSIWYLDNLIVNKSGE